MGGPEPVPLSESTIFSAASAWDALDPSQAWTGDWRRLRSRDQVALLNQLVARGGGRVELAEIGRSPEGNPLHTLRLGRRGGRRVLMWARQHGDEPECTAALNTVLHKLVGDPAWPVGAAILEACDILVFPMVNPDGADRCTRACAMGIDLNREARVQETPEGALLAGLQRTFQPEFAFNLHDMNPRRTTRTGKPDVVAIAFQSCPFDETDRDNPQRLKAKAVIAEMLDAVRTQTPFIARYAADFMKRGFGDAMMSWGAASILIESGSRPPGHTSDSFVIRLHALALATGLYAIATGADERADPAAYDTIPFDAGAFEFDHMVRGAKVFDAATRLCVGADLAWATELQEPRVDECRQYRSAISGVGDLYAEWAREEVAAAGHVLVPGAVAIACERAFDDPAAVAPFLRAGITTLVGSAGPFRDNRQRRDFVEASLATPISINAMVFEMTLSAQDIVRRHGLTPLAGFHVPGLHIALGELREFARRWHPALRAALDDADAAWGYGLDLFFRGAGSPLDTRLVLCLHPEDEQLADRRAGVTDAQTLHLIAEAFLSSSRQVAAAVCLDGDFGLAIDTAASRCFVRADEGLPPDFIGRVASLRGDATAAVASLTHGIADALSIPGLGLLRPRCQADIVALDESLFRTEAAAVAPRWVAVNGEFVVMDGKPRPVTPTGRWIFA